MGRKSKKKDEPLYLANALFPKPMFAAVSTSESTIPTAGNQNPIHVALLCAGKLATGQFGYDIAHTQRDSALNTVGMDSDESEPKARSDRILSGQYDVINCDYDNSARPRCLSYEHPENDDEEVIIVAKSDELNAAGPESSDVLLSKSSTDVLNADGSDHQYSDVSKPEMSPGEIQADSEHVLRNQVVRLKKENWTLQERMREILAQLREMQQQREERDLIIREKDSVIDKLKMYVSNLETERSQYLDDLNLTKDKVESMSKRASINSPVTTNDPDESIDLKRLLVKTTEELSRYQLKYRSPMTSDNKGLPFTFVCPPWITNPRYLSPLIMAYEDRIQEKDIHISNLEKEFSVMKDKIEELVRENQSLHVENSLTVKQMEWELLQEQAKLVLEENQVLMEEIDTLQNKNKQQQAAHISEVARLTRRAIAMESDKSQIEDELRHAQFKFEKLRKQYENEVIGVDEKVSAESHNALIEKLKAELEESKEQSKIDVENLLLKLTRADTEIQHLMHEKITYHEDMNSLREEVRTVLKLQKRWQKKALLLEQKLNFADEKEHLLNEQIQTALTCAEQATQERDNMGELLNTQVSVKNQTIAELQDKQFTSLELEEKMHTYKVQLKNKVKKQAAAINDRLKELELKESYYLREIDGLKEALHTEKEKSNRLLENKQSLESSFEALWRSAKEQDIP